jgi:hypothetical protein
MVAPLFNPSPFTTISLPSAPLAATQSPLRNLSQFVARKYWRECWATLYRFQAHGVENGAFSSGASRPLWIN